MKTKMNDAAMEMVAGGWNRPDFPDMMIPRLPEMLGKEPDFRKEPNNQPMAFRAR